MDQSDRTALQLEEALETHLQTLAPYAATIASDPLATIRPTRKAGGGATDRVARLLERLEAQGPRELDEVVDYEQTLGEGGMAVVHLATQKSLGRKVAVKTLRPEIDDAGATEALLREAWVTGALEHPNVVPVHTLGLDSERRPCIVLKRIEGVTWAELMRDAEAVPKQFGAGDLLEWNLRILMQVCNALRLAHSRGILHRDLKPQNVMVGSFGEVYLLDWGIAVSLIDDGSGRFPIAEEQGYVAGTPGYMAPEMLGPGAGALSERTDVYLLGSILYEIVAGRAPHQGRTLEEMLRSVLISQPPIPPEVPGELRDLLDRALAASPSDRIESAEEFRLALQDFLQHRGAIQLVRRAEQQLDAMRAELATSRTEPTAQRQRLYRHFGECRFGFRQALESWSGSVAAAQGLARATEAMVEFELTAGSPEAAAALLADLREPRPDLGARVDAALGALEEDRRRVDALRQLGRDVDSSIGRRTRLVAGVVLGVLWTVASILGWKLEAWFEPRRAALMFSGIALGLTLGLVWWGRESLMKTAFNRRAMGTLILVFAAQLALHGGAELGSMSLEDTALFNILLWCVATAMFAITVDWRLAPAAVVYLAAFLATARWPEDRFLWVAISNMLLTVNLIIAWRATRQMRAESPGKESR